MTFASEDLRNEHDGVLFGLDILEQMARTVDQSGATESVDVVDIVEMVNFFRLFADKCHHGKEEGLMFPAMVKVGIPNEGGPIGQMLLEHNQGRRHIADIGASVAEGILQPDPFVKAANGYVTLMRAHIAKENTVLFPMGDRLLPMEVQKQLLLQFEAFEEEVMGKGTHEKLHETLNRFAEKYLHQS